VWQLAALHRKPVHAEKLEVPTYTFPLVMVGTTNFVALPRIVAAEILIAAVQRVGDVARGAPEGPLTRRSYTRCSRHPKQSCCITIGGIDGVCPG
jgi:hypothetical protein